MRFIQSLYLAAGLLSVAVLSACQAAPAPEPVTAEAPPARMTDVIEIREPGLIANYYPAATANMPGPALLMVGGSEGGLSEGVAVEAEALREEGISVLHLSFYRFEGQEQNLELVPLERFDTALDWLLARGEVDAGRVGIYGTSKGAEAALITATRHPELEAVVAIVPSSVSWTGINWDFDGREPEASWSLNGSPYPALPYGAFDYETGLYSLYANGLDAVDAQFARCERTRDQLQQMGLLAYYETPPHEQFVRHLDQPQPPTPACTGCLPPPRGPLPQFLPSATHN